MLQLWAKAVISETVPSSDCSWLCSVRPWITTDFGQSMRVAGVAPPASAAAAVMILNVEPGG